MYKKTCLALAVLALGGCRIVSQQELADLKSPPNPHMANIDKTWQQSIVPQVVAHARPAAELMSALKAQKDIDSACKALGYRAQDENPCIFYVKVAGAVSKLDSASRSGKMTLADGSIGNVVVQIGPTLRGTLQATVMLQAQAIAAQGVTDLDNYLQKGEKPAKQRVMFRGILITQDNADKVQDFNIKS